MTIEDLQKICSKLKGVKEDIKWDDHLCFNVGDKIFLITAPDAIPVTATFKVGDEDFEEITSKEGFSPAKYLSRYKWVFVDDINRISKKDWERFIKQSYDLVFERLPVKIKKFLGL
ncbi:MAG: MmcQ/YjbR family DNA-binding protein [Bacteroidia bacterium]|nr:MmcQ/YjbR family DNA-binding protein [Bacteroidia bacterium]